MARRQPIDPGTDQRLQGVGDPLDGSVAAALEHHADRLLDEERIAFRLLEQRAAQVGLEAVGLLGQQRLDETLALGAAERFELDRGRPDTASAPAGMVVEQLGAREAELQERRPHPVGEVLDQVEQRLLRPVDVLEDEDDGLRLGELLDERTRRPGDLLRRAVALERLEHARREPEQVGDRLVLAAGLELLERLLDRVVVRDPGDSLDHLGERPVRDALPVRESAALQHRRALEPVDELARQAALADTGLAVDREQVGAPVADGPVERVRQAARAPTRGRSAARGCSRTSRPTLRWRTSPATPESRCAGP